MAAETPFFREKRFITLFDRRPSIVPPVLTGPELTDQRLPGMQTSTKVMDAFALHRSWLCAPCQFALQFCAGIEHQLAIRAQYTKYSCHTVAPTVIIRSTSTVTALSLFPCVFHVLVALIWRARRARSKGHKNVIRRRVAAVVTGRTSCVFWHEDITLTPRIIATSSPIALSILHLEISQSSKQLPKTTRILGKDDVTVLPRGISLPPHYYNSSKNSTAVSSMPWAPGLSVCDCRSLPLQ